MYYAFIAINITITASLDCSLSNTNIENILGDNTNIENILVDVFYPEEPNRLNCNNNDLLKQYEQEICEIYNSRYSCFSEYMSLHSQLKEERYPEHWAWNHIIETLAVKMLFEISNGYYEDFSQTFVCLFQYYDILSQGKKQRCYTIRRTIQDCIYGLCFSFDLFQYLNEESMHLIINYLLKQEKEKQLVNIIYNDSVTFMELFLEREFSSKGLFQDVLGKIYKAPIFKKFEKSNIYEYADYLSEFIDSGRPYTEYEDYILKVGGLPGYFYSQEMIKTYEVILRSEFTYMNKARILRFALFVHRYNRKYKIFPSSLSDILVDKYINDISTNNSSMSSLLTGYQLQYEFREKSFMLSFDSRFHKRDNKGKECTDSIIYIGCLGNSGTAAHEALPSP